MLDSTTIAINRYAPIGCDQIKLYSNGFSGGSDLTLGQLVIAVSMRSAAVCEAQSVVKMNMMASGSLYLDKTSEYMEQLANDEMSDWAAARSYLINELEIDADDLPEAVDSFTKRLQAIDAIKVKVDALTQLQQTHMIDLQTLVNRRDVACSTSTNMIRTLGASMSKDAANFG